MITVYILSLFPSRDLKKQQMPVFKPDSLSRNIAYIAVFFGIAALVLTCVGVGTPAWYAGYISTGGGNYTKYDNANFFYTCVYYSNSTLQNCTNRGSSLYGYPGYNPSNPNPWMSDYYQRMQNAGALCIVGIIFLFIGTLTTLIMAIVYFQTWATLIPPVCLFLACHFMLAGMAEGSRYLLFNDYSANLYQTGHLLTMFTLFLSSFAAGRIHFSRWTEAGKVLP
jgi:hypothetical protein